MRRLLLALGLLTLTAVPAMAYMILATTVAPPPPPPSQGALVILNNVFIVLN